MVSVSRGPRPFLAAFLALAAIIAALSGCSSSDEGSREAANLGTRICILNSGNEEVLVQYTLKDSDTGTGPLGTNQQSCAEGTSAMDCDLNGVITHPESGLQSVFTLYNPLIGAPIAWVNQSPSSGPNQARVKCYTRPPGWSVGEKRTWDNGPVRVSIERLPDDQWKEFVLIIEAI